jgi:transposase InsO family protein
MAGCHSRQGRAHHGRRPEGRLSAGQGEPALPRRAAEPALGRGHALAETINGLYKAELVHRRAPWKTREALELATQEWVPWFNHHRLLEPIGYVPPAEFEDAYYRQLTESAISD